MIRVKSRRLLVGALWLMIGTGLTRVMPIAIGMVFARTHTPQAYADFLAFIVAANLIAAIPLMGTTQLILSAPVNVSHASLLRNFIRPLLLMQGVSGLCLIFLMMALSGSVEKKLGINEVSLYIYSLGYCLTGMMVAVFNKAELQVNAGRCWILTIFTSTLFCLVGFLLSTSADTALLYLAVGGLVGGVLCVWWGRVTLQRSGADVAAREVICESEAIDIRHIIVFGSPSVIFLFGFYWLIQQVQSAGDPVRAGAFSLGYQLFSVALFLPGVLGNIVTPRLGRVRDDVRALKKLLTHLFLGYAAVAVLIGALIYLVSPWMLMAFNIPNAPDARSLIMILQFAVMIAALQALINQWMASERLSRHILSSAVIWLALIMAFTSLAGDASTMSAWGLVLAYAGSFLYGGAVLLKRVYGGTINDTVC